MAKPVPPPPPRRRPGRDSAAPQIVSAGTKRSGGPAIKTARSSQRWKQRDGLTPDTQYRGTIRGFSVSLMLLALFQLIPAVLAFIHNQQLEEPELIPRWVYLLMLGSVLQMAYAFYLWQLPDWSSLWVVALFSLGMAALYAGLLAIRLLAVEDHSLLATLQLNLADISPGRQAGWCLVLLILFGSYCYFSGRAGLKWFQRFKGNESTKALQV